MQERVAFSEIFAGDPWFARSPRFSHAMVACDAEDSMYICPVPRPSVTGTALLIY